MKQFIYVLKQVPRLFDDAAWTEQDNEITADHFRRLQDLHAKGTVVLAGRTLNDGAARFGIVILEVESEEEARQIMETDPAVIGGVMTAELFPYRVALLRGAAG